MASAKTSLNGYKYGREPETETPFWGGESGGAEIDDSTTSTVKTWSSKKISDELAEKADVTDLANYAKTTAVYTKAQTYSKGEVDELLSHIEPTVDAYTKAETNALLETKAAVTSVYTKSQTYSKSEVDNLLSQIPAVDAYTKAQTDSLLDAKANASDVYTKSQVDSLIPDVSGLATKTELNSGLAECAKATSVYTKSQTYSKSEVDDLISGATPAPVDAYTKTQTDSLLAAKADKTELADYAKVTSVYTKSQTYTKTEVDSLISDIPAVDAYTKTQTDNLLADKADKSDTYTKTQVDNLIPDVSGLATKTELTSGLATKADVSALADYAKVTSVYTKAQTYTKTEVDNLIAGAGGGGAAIDDTATNTDSTWSSFKINSELNTVKDEIKDSITYFSDVHGLFRYTTNYGSNTELEDGELYDITGDIVLNVDGTQVYLGGLKEIPYNDLAESASQTNIKGTGKYLWKDWAITYSTGFESYLEIPVKIAFIGQKSANSKYNPYIHIIYPYKCNHTITFECRATNYTKVPSSSGGGGGLQEYAYTIATPSSTTISTAIKTAIAGAITNVGIDNMEKLRKIVARTEWMYNTTPHVKECVYDVKYLNISKGGGNFDDIDICAVGGEHYYSGSAVFETYKLLASRYTGVLERIQKDTSDGSLLEIDFSSNNVGDNAGSPWAEDNVNNATYKIIFVYG